MTTLEAIKASRAIKAARKHNHEYRAEAIGYSQCNSCLRTAGEMQRFSPLVAGKRGGVYCGPACWKADQA